ncbi:Uncharacterized protein Fot_42453 [Forsythia ovata]|uniref:Uncharacterized protein n=1 Tax=Forsythia ovata TaxID=205694 RepID=A0ABD1RLV8_9LAMI
MRNDEECKFRQNDPMMQNTDNRREKSLKKRIFRIDGGRGDDSDLRGHIRWASAATATRVGICGLMRLVIVAEQEQGLWTSLTSCGVNEVVCTILESPNVPRATVYTAHRGTSTASEEQPAPTLYPVVLAFGPAPCNHEAYGTRRPRLPCEVLARYVSTWGRRWWCYHALTSLLYFSHLGSLAAIFRSWLLLAMSGFYFLSVPKLKIRRGGVVEDISPPPPVPSATPDPGVTVLQTPEIMVGSPSSFL